MWFFQFVNGLLVLLFEKKPLHYITSLDITFISSMVALIFA